MQHHRCSHTEILAFKLMALSFLRVVGVYIPSVPKLLHYSTLFVNNCFWVPQRKDCIAEIVLESILGAVILTRDLDDFFIVISGDWGL